MKAHVKKVLSFVLTMVMMLAILPMPSGLATEPFEPGIVLGSATLSAGKFYYDNAMVTGIDIRTILISFSDSVTSGDKITLPASPAGFTVSASSASNDYTKRISLNAGIAASDVQDYIRGVGFTLASQTQTVQVTVTTEVISQDTFYNADTGHYYQFISDTTSTWMQAYDASKVKTYMGRTGYLATVMSLGEDTFVNALSNGKTGWLGGTILTNTGTSAGSLYYNGFNDNSVVSTGWYWACGPEKGTTFYNVNTLYPNNNDTTFTNQKDALNSSYYNWARGISNEPNNNTAGFYLNSDYETCLSTLKVSGRTGKHGTVFSWNDIRYNYAGSDSYHSNGYVVEYGDQLFGDSGNAVNTFATDSGTLEAMYTATVNTYVDGVLSAAPGSVELKQDGSTVYTLSSGATGVYTTSAVNGTYDVYINNEDTGKDITINNGNGNTTVNYYTVTFTVSNTGTASGSTILGTAGGSSITSGTTVLAGKSITITAAGAGAASYTYAWSGTGTSSQTTAAITIPSLSGTVNASCVVTGTTTYEANIYTATDAVFGPAPGIVELKQNDITMYTAISNGIGRYTANAVNGTYNVFINGEDTKKNILIDGANAGVTVNYHTVSFAVQDAGTASGSTVTAVSGGKTITSGTVLLADNGVSITATGAGADMYTYAWTGPGSNFKTGPALHFLQIPGPLDVLCTVTGSDGPPTYLAGVLTSINGTEAAAPGAVELWQGGALVSTVDAAGPAGLYITEAENGTYDVYINHEDTGEDITIDGDNGAAYIDYFTVSFAVQDADAASGSTILATAGGAAITNGAAVLSGKTVTITATGVGADTYTYLWSGPGTNSETAEAITIPVLSGMVDAMCTVTGTTIQQTYAANIFTYIDTLPAAAPGDVKLWQSGAKVYTASVVDTGYYTASAINGTYDIYINNEDTGLNVIIAGADADVYVDYYTVSFAVTDLGTASGSTISATAGGTNISSGAAVLQGKAVTITAFGAGADNYTYLWSGSGTSGETADSLAIASLSGTVNALCTVTGAANVYAPGTLEEEEDDITIVAEGPFTQDARLYIIPMPEGDTTRESLEALQSGKQTAAAFEVYIEPANAFQPPLTLSFGLGGQFNGKTVYILHRLHNGDVEHFNVTVANGEAVITVQELSPFLLSLDPPVTITSQPQSVTIVTGQTATFSVTATGAGPLTYQWQKKTGSSASWEDIPGATSAEHTTSKANLSNSGFSYRVIVTDAMSNSVTSDTAVLTVTKKPETPETGDHSQPALYALLMLLFMAATVLLLRKRKAA